MIRSLLVFFVIVLGVTLGSGPTLAGASGSELPEFNLLSTGGGTIITEMNMSSGEFSGTAVVSGEDFRVTGTEHGDTEIAQLTLVSDPSYVSRTPIRSTFADGNVSVKGCFKDTNDHTRCFSGAIVDAAGTTPTNTKVTCDASRSCDTCTAKVTGADGTRPATQPSRPARQLLGL